MTNKPLPAEVGSRSPLPRPDVMAAEPVAHGAIDYVELERLGIDPEQLLDFSVNSNPYGPAPGVRQALTGVPPDRYPDRDALSLRRALSTRLGVTTDQIVIGNGTSELLWLTAAAYLRPGDRVVVIGPTFGEYARVSQLMGAWIESWTASPEEHFSVDENAITRLVEECRPRLVFVNNPNNPTGIVLPIDLLSTWAKASPGSLLVVDEAYAAFALDFQSALELNANNVLLLRSMTKDHALAGLRLGYAAGPVEVIETLQRVRPAWNVNAFALAAGLAALTDAGQEHLERSMKALRLAKEGLIEGLETLGLAPVPSAINYFLVQVGSGAVFRRRLLEQGILVRDCASFGLPAYARIASRSSGENQALLDAIRSQVDPDSVTRGAGADGS
jgi:histidinol-phosphate aminotransferase